MPMPRNLWWNPLTWETPDSQPVSRWDKYWDPVAKKYKWPTAPKSFLPKKDSVSMVATRKSSASARNKWNKALDALRKNPRFGKNVKKRVAVKATAARLSTKGKGGAKASTSSGFFGTGSKVTKKSKTFKVLSTGISHTSETGKLVTSDHCRYIGHATWCSGSIMLYTCIAVIKQIFVKAGRNITSIDSTISDATTDNISFIYRLDDDPGSAESTVVVGNVASYPTLRLMGAELMIALNTIAWTTSTRVIELRYNALSGTHVYDSVIYQMETAKVTLDIKSTLKIQNRSSNTDNEADDVDNVPLYGKQYGGNGNGVLKKGGTFGNQPFLADDTYGVMTRDGNTTDTREPMIPETFTYCKTSAKAKLEPGEIKTSTLTYNKVHMFNPLITELQIGVASAVSDRTGRGTFRLFAFEKMLEVYPTTIIPIEVAFECNQNLKVGFTPGYKRAQLCQTFTQAAYPY